MLKWVLWVQDVCTEGGVLKRVVEVQTEEAGIKFQVYGLCVKGRLKWTLENIFHGEKSQRWVSNTPVLFRVGVTAGIYVGEVWEPGECYHSGKMLDTG